MRFIAGTEARLMLREPAWLIAFTLMPLGLIVVLKGAFGIWLVGRMGVTDATGAELAVGGQAALFNIMLLANFGLFLYRDYSTGVWDRLRSSFAGPAEVLGGKLSATWAAHFAQFLALVLISQPLFGLPALSRIGPLLVTIVCSVTCTIAMGFMMFAFYRSSNAFEATAMMAAMVLGALGGAFAPRGALPSWTEPFQLLSPVTWTEDCFESLFVFHEPASSVLGPCGVLLLMAAVFAVIGLVRFDPHEQKAKNR
jgi:ABC-type multidrug transport system permease subunit